MIVVPRIGAASMLQLVAGNGSTCALHPSLPGRREHPGCIGAGPVVQRGGRAFDNHYGFHKGHCGVAARCGGPIHFEDLAVVSDGVAHSGGFDNASLQGDFSPVGLILQYAWLPEEATRLAPLDSPASANFSPLFATGPGAERLGGFASIADVGRVIGAWLEP